MIAGPRESALLIAVPEAGAIDVVVPHLTVATHGSVEMEGSLRAGLPIEAVASEVLLMEQDEGGTWSVRERFPLGGGG